MTCEWDFAGDGRFDDGTGLTPLFSAADLHGPLTRTITLRVTNSAGDSVLDSAAITILPRVLYVDSFARGMNNGLCWADAFVDLQAALANAVAGKAIHVAQGTYKPTAGTDRSAAFVLQSGVSLLGGYAGYDAVDPNERDTARYPSVLSGDIGAVGTASDNSYHVVTASNADATAVLDGFTITAGSSSGAASAYSGGGMYLNHGSPTVRRCILWGNTSLNGSQIYKSSGTPALTCSDIQGGYNGAGNINSDPLFIRSPSAGPDKKWGTADDDYGDVRLRPGSPCIDAGNSAAVTAGITSDLAGNPRFVNVPGIPASGDTGVVVDMGAYEAPNPDLSLSSAGGYYLSLSSDRASVQIWTSAAANGTPIIHATASLRSLHLADTAGANTITIDLSNGNPLPAGGVTFDGGAVADTLILAGTSAADSLTIGSAQIALSLTIITPTNIGAIVLDSLTGPLIQLAGLSLINTGKVSLPSSGGKVLKVGALSMADTAVLDLGANSLLVQPDAAGCAPDEVLNQIADWIAEGRIAAPAGLCRGLAAIRNDRGDGVAAMGQFQHQAVDVNSIVVQYTLNGDTDLNGKIDAADYLRLDYGFLTGKSSYRFGDFNRSGAINADDYAAIDAAFLTQLGMPAAKAAVRAKAAHRSWRRSKASCRVGWAEPTPSRRSPRSSPASA